MTFKTPWNKIVAKIILMGLVSYIVYNLFLVYQKSESISNFINKIWNYVVIKNVDFQLTIGKLFIEIGLLIGSYYLAQYLSKKLVSSILQKTSLDIGARSSVLKLSNYGILTVLVIISLSLAQIPLTAFTFVGGALAIGAGFGTQNIINNFISGIIIQIEKPIKVGDTVFIEGQNGKIDEIGARSTKVLLNNNTHLIIPNSFFLEKNISNWHLKNDLIKSKILIELHLTQSFEKFKIHLTKNLEDIHLTNLDFSIIDIKPTGYISEISFDLKMDSVNKTEIESKVKEKIIELSQQSVIKIAQSK
jgi:potassium-dependent mechanosensitive channel